MDVFGRTPIAVQNKLIEDNRRFFENRLNKHGALITEHSEKITGLITAVQTLENKINLLETKCADVEIRFMAYARKTTEIIYELTVETRQIASVHKTVATLADHIDNLEHPKLNVK
jgi:phage shock protein A